MSGYRCEAEAVAGPAREGLLYGPGSCWCACGFLQEVQAVVDRAASTRAWPVCPLEVGPRVLSG
jgi:hypothetical protein